jgi:hypothetical protein
VLWCENMYDACSFYSCTYIDYLNSDTEILFILKLNEDRTVKSNYWLRTWRCSYPFLIILLFGGCIELYIQLVDLLIGKLYFPVMAVRPETMFFFFYFGVRTR